MGVLMEWTWSEQAGLDTIEVRDAADSLGWNFLAERPREVVNIR